MSRRREIKAGRKEEKEREELEEERDVGRQMCVYTLTGTTLRASPKRIVPGTIKKYQ